MKLPQNLLLISNQVLAKEQRVHFTWVSFMLKHQERGEGLESLDHPAVLFMKKFSAALWPTNNTMILYMIIRSSI